ncbi:MAG TPA: nuclear transport factor 2 family protein [Novosphingobium sp.]
MQDSSQTITTDRPEPGRDWLDIRSKLDLYGFAVDALRWDLFEQIFAGNSLFVRHADNSAYTSLAAFVEAFDRVHRRFDRTRHSMTNAVIDIADSQARSLTYGQWRLIKDGSPGGDIWRSEGWYEDEWTRGPDGWRIVRRQSWELWGEGNCAIIGTDPEQFAQRCRPLASSTFARSIGAG